MVTALRLPLAVAFVWVDRPLARLAVLGLAGASDLLDGILARRLGPSRVGHFLDPVVDKVFASTALATASVTGALTLAETLGCIFRDLVLSLAYVVLRQKGRTVRLPARASGKLATLAQTGTLAAWLLGVPGPWLSACAALTTALGGWAVFDYTRVTGVGTRREGEAR